MKSYGEVEVWLHALLISALIGVGVVSFTPRPVYSRGRTPGTYWIGGWVDPRDGLDVMAKRKIPASVSNRTLVIQPLA
jgi:hypothetical protein